MTNDAADAVAATVAVRRAVGTGGIATATPLYEETHSLSAGETVEADDVLPEEDTYRVTVALENGTTESADVEGEPTRGGLVEIRVESPDEISIG